MWLMKKWTNTEVKTMDWITCIILSFNPNPTCLCIFDGQAWRKLNWLLSASDSIFQLFWPEEDPFSESFLYYQCYWSAHYPLQCSHWSRQSWEDKTVKHQNEAPQNEDWEFTTGWMSVWSELNQHRASLIRRLNLLHWWGNWPGAHLPLPAF